jgi:LCP family protein required for cell wall assembly
VRREERNESVTQVEARASDEPGDSAESQAVRLGAHQEAGHDSRRGSHATQTGQGFSWVLRWTILGAVMPGTGLIAAGRRRAGGVVLVVVGIALLVVAALAATGDPVKRVLDLAVKPQQLLALAALAAVGTLLWAVVIVVTNRRLTRFATLTTVQRVLSGAVVLALIVAVGVPGFEVSRYALIQRDLVKAVFDSSEQQAGRNQAAPNTVKADPWASTPRINVLLIGSDAGADRVGVRPDTLILASINTRSGDVVMFSLPRNLERVPFPLGTGGNQAWPNGFYCPQDQCLLNAIWQWAETDGKKYYPDLTRPGLAATEDAVQGITGLRVDTYAMLNLAGFPAVVNAMGGVTVDIHERLPIGGNGDPTSSYYHNPSGWLEPGDNQHLNGYKALWFARSRYTTSDFDRMRRQRCVIGAVVDQADVPKVARGFPALAKAAKSNISTGIELSELPAWVELTMRIQKADSVRSLPFDDHVVPNRVDPDYPHIRELVADALNPPLAGTSTPTTVPSPSVSPTKKPRKPRVSATDEPENPDVAQNVNDVC